MNLTQRSRIESNFTASIRKSVRRFVVLILFSGITLSFAVRGSAQQTVAANLIIQSFPVGNFPVGLCFDGAGIWVVNSVSDTVTKLRASDGTVQGTFPVG